MKDDEITLLAEELGAVLAARGLVVSVAESCTGGGLAEAITRVPGSSAWFDRGYVTYSNDAKVAMLGVDRATIEAHGAVSEQTARAMVSGLLRESPASVAASITGVAGPGGGTVDKPVGLVCFAWAFRDGEVQAETRTFGGERAGVRRQSVAFALRGLLELLRRRPA